MNSSRRGTIGRGRFAATGGYVPGVIGKESVELRIYSHADERSEQVHSERGEDRVGSEVHQMELLSKVLLGKIRDLISEPVIPIVVMRGGMLMWNARHACLPAGPFGVVAPARSGHRHTTRPEIVYANIPTAATAETTYLLLDPIINSGATIVATVGSIRTHVGSTNRIVVAAIHSTMAGNLRICAADPLVDVHALWTDVAVGPDLRLKGVNFDAGDAAFGGPAQRYRWSAST